MFNRPIDLRGLDRFKRYGTFMRDVNIIAGKQQHAGPLRFHVSTDLIRELVLISNAIGYDMFPLITQLHITPLDIDSAKCLVSLIHEPLQNLDLSWELGGFDALTLTLMRIQAKVTRLKSLTLQVSLPTDSQKPRDDVSLFLFHLANTFRHDSLNSLVRLELPATILFDLQGQMSEAVGSLPALNELQALGKGRTRFVTQSSSATFSFDDGFLSLSILRCTLPYQHALDMLASSKPRPSLSLLDLSVFTLQPAASVQALISHMAGFAPDATHVALFIEGACLPITKSALQPFLDQKSIEDLTVHSDVAATLSDDDYWEVARELPNLTHLSISPHPTSVDGPDRPTATLLALSHIATYCHAMKSLEIYVDGSLERLAQGHSLQAFSETLEYVDLGFSPSGPVLKTASQLLRMMYRSQAAIVSKGAERRAVRGLAVHSPFTFSEARRRWDGVAATMAQLRPLVDSISKDADDRFHQLELRVKDLERRQRHLVLGTSHDAVLQQSRLDQLNSTSSPTPNDDQRT